MSCRTRQFICRTCPGKLKHHKFRVWYERVPDSNPVSECHICKKNIQAVPTGQELYVHICHFKCHDGHPLHRYTVRCKMSDTAPCYKCPCSVCPDECPDDCPNRKQVSPHTFTKLRRINRKSDNKHNCSECNGAPDCPNMKPQPGEGAMSRNPSTASLAGPEAESRDSSHCG